MDSRMAARGLTLAEMLVALAIMSVLAGLAMPAYQASLRAAALRASVFTLLAGLQHVRTQAILQARPGTFCAADAAGVCVPASVPGTAWRTAFSDSPDPQDGARPGGWGVPVHQTLPSGVVVHSTRSPIWFWPHSSAASTGTLTICDVHRVAPPRAIVISQTGRARLADAPRSACG
jgi:type IV fimbrial biogenesis protein FimT